MALSRYKVFCVIIRQRNVCHGSLSTNQSGSEIDLQSETLNFERGNFVVSISARIDGGDIETTSVRKKIRPEKFILYQSSFAAVSMRKRTKYFVFLWISSFTEIRSYNMVQEFESTIYHSSGSEVTGTGYYSGSGC